VNLREHLDDAFGAYLEDEDSDENGTINFLDRTTRKRTNDVLNPLVSRLVPEIDPAKVGKEVMKTIDPDEKSPELVTYGAESYIATLVSRRFDMPLLVGENPSYLPAERGEGEDLHIIYVRKDLYTEDEGKCLRDALKQITRHVESFHAHFGLNPDE